MIRDENLQTGTNSAINYDRMLSPVVLEAIQNDAHRITSYNVCYTKLLRVINYKGT